MTHPNHLPNVVALAGRAGAGKSTLAEILVREHGYTRLRFAGPLKDMLRVLGLTDAELDGPLKNEPCARLGGRTPRHAMQTLGTEWGRQMITPDLWCSAWARQARDCLGRGGRVVCDDYRFPLEEGTVLAAVGALVVKVERPGLPCGDHVSERLVDAIVPHATVVNDGSVDELHRRLLAALGALDGR